MGKQVNINYDLLSKHASEIGSVKVNCKGTKVDNNNGGRTADMDDTILQMLDKNSNFGMADGLQGTLPTLVNSLMENSMNLFNGIAKKEKEVDDEVAKKVRG